MGKSSAVVVVVLGMMIGVIGCGGDSKENQQCGQKRPQDMLSAAYRFSEKDFQKERASENLFYVPEGDDDGMKEVRPNLKRMPALLNNAPDIAEGFLPPSEGDNRGKVYFCHPDSYEDTIVHVGDGWVVAQSSGVREHVGFIYTNDDDMYVDGQRLKGGYYVLVGRQKVPLANGSSMSMYAFVSLSPESNRMAVEAYKYNAKAVSETKVENYLRNQKRDQFKKEMNRRQFTSELAKLFQGFSFRSLKSQFHLPEDIADAINSIEEVHPGKCDFFGHDDYKPEIDFLNAIQTNNWEYVAKCLWLDCDLIKDPIVDAKYAFSKTHLFERKFRIARRDSLLMKSLGKYEFYVVDRYGRDGGKLYRVFTGEPVRLPIDADVHCIRKEDEELFKKFLKDDDVDGFIATCKEREECNKRIDKITRAYHEELDEVFANLLLQDVESHYHFPTNAKVAYSIKVADNCNFVMYGNPFYEGEDREINKALKDHDWEQLGKNLGLKISPDSDPVQCAKDTFARIAGHWRMFRLKWCRNESQIDNRRIRKVKKNNEEPEAESVFCFFIVNATIMEQVQFVGEKNSRGVDPDFKVKIGADLFCVPKEDKSLFDKIADAKVFEETWNKKYGKLANE